MSKTEGKTKGKHPGSENLIPFKKGESGNPNGRPKGQKNYATLYREALEKIAKSKKMTFEELELELHQVGLDKALAGNDKFYHQVLDRIHGKPQQHVDHTTDGQPIQVVSKIPDDSGDSV